MRPVHPGEILKEEIETLGLSARAFASALDVPPNRVTAILNEERAVTADTALRLSKFFGNAARFWLNLQISYDLGIAEQKIGDALVRVRTAQEVSKAARPVEEISAILEDHAGSTKSKTLENVEYTQAARRLSETMSGLAEPIHAFAKLADCVSDAAEAIKMPREIAEKNAELAALSGLAAPLEEMANSMRRLEKAAQHLQDRGTVKALPSSHAKIRLPKRKIRVRREQD